LSPYRIDYATAKEKRRCAAHGILITDAGAL